MLFEFSRVFKWVFRSSPHLHSVSSVFTLLSHCSAKLFSKSS